MAMTIAKVDPSNEAIPFTPHIKGTVSIFIICLIPAGKKTPIIIPMGSNIKASMAIFIYITWATYVNITYLYKIVTRIITPDRTTGNDFILFFQIFYRSNSRYCNPSVIRPLSQEKIAAILDFQLYIE